MERLDPRAVLADEAELRAAEDLQRATYEWRRFTAMSVLQLRPTVQGLLQPAPLGLLFTPARALPEHGLTVRLFRNLLRCAARRRTGSP